MNIEKKSWNPFLNLVIELKKRCKEKNIPLTYERDKMVLNKTCINRWLEKLNDNEMNAYFSGIKLWENQDNEVVAHYNDYFTFHYDDEEQTEGSYEDFFKAFDSLYMECRGITIDPENEEIVCCPYRKFFNLDENEMTKYDDVLAKIKNAKTIEFTDKKDGSLITASFYNGKIRVSGSSCNEPIISITIQNSINYIDKHENYQDMIKNYPDYTFIFEHIFPAIDTHVVKYEENGLYLTGIRNKKTGEEYMYEFTNKIAKKYDVPITEIVDTNLNDILNSLDSKESTEAEGFVMNINGYKVKIKYNDYIVVHKLLFALKDNGTEGFSYKKLFEIINNNQFDDLISKMPENHKETLISIHDEIIHKLKEIEDSIDYWYDKLIDENLSRKENMIRLEILPKELLGRVKSKYLKQPVLILKNKLGHFISYADFIKIYDGIVSFDEKNR